jgi:hypothetical protein
MCETEKIKELKLLLKDFYISDEEMMIYIKNSYHYDNLKYEMKDAIVREYIRRQELESEEKQKKDFLIYLQNIQNK